MNDYPARRATRRNHLLLFLSAASLGACATVPTAGVSTADRPDPPAVHWTLTAAEHAAVFLQTYVLAAERVEAMANGLGAGRWAVVLDGDETVLDNAEYQRRRARLGQGFTLESWFEWAREERARALPGATAFIHRVQELGGRAVIVTNRDDEICEPTRRNLEALRIEVDLVMCRVNGVSDKEPRFQALETGTAAPALPALRILAWVGDNIEDFPGGTQELRESGPAAFADFGQRFFMLPNPMYGSWERNPPGGDGGGG